MRSLKKLDDWLNYLASSHPLEIDLGLERIEKVFKILNIDFNCPVVTISGTNGKGSTCKFLSAMFSAGNYRVACMTSPHLLRFNERACIGDREISDEDLILHFKIVENARKKLTPSPSLSFFEFTTLAIIHFFFQSDPDLVILEVGMGGRLDAVNVVDADYAVVTNVNFDHTNYLGSTLEEIAFEKAGIFRKKRPVIIGDPKPPKSLLNHATFMECPLYLSGRDFYWTLNKQKKSGVWSYFGPHKKSLIFNPPALFGKNQLTNASIALTVAELLEDSLYLEQNAKKAGLETAKLLGRFQVLPGLPMRILDVAHNTQSAKILSKNLSENTSFFCTHAIFGAFADKDIFGIAKSLADQVDYWYLTLLPSDRSASLKMLCSKLEEAGISKSTIKGTFVKPIDAYQYALMNCTTKDRIVVFGSFLTVSGLYHIF